MAASKRAQAAERPPPPPSFVYPPLPAWELTIHFSVIIVMFCICWYRTIALSLSAPSTLYYGDYDFEPGRVPLLGWQRQRSRADYEWVCFFGALRPLLTCLAASSLALRLLDWATQDADKKKLGLALTSWLLMFHLTGRPLDVLVMTAEGLFMFASAKVLRFQALVWVEAAGFLTLNFLYTDVSETTYMGLVVRQYSLFHFISFCVEELVHAPTPGRSAAAQLLDFHHYYLYLPFKFHLIMPYRLFQRRLAERDAQPRALPALAAYAARIAFWTWMCEVLTYVAYFRPVVSALCPLEPGAVLAHTPDANSRITQASLNFASGIAFHIKYAVIFGLPSIFLHLDRMQPLRPPICVARVSLYSQIWREFDRGLYLFIKYQVYIPICRPTFSIARKLLAGVLVFLVVLVWHDVSYSITVWILLNVAVLSLRGAAVAAYHRYPGVKWLCHERLSPPNLRRLIGLLQAPLVILSLISIFYFLNGAAERVEEGDWLWRLFLTEDWGGGPSWNGLGQIALGYSFAQFCIQVQLWLDQGADQKHKKE